MGAEQEDEVAAPVASVGGGAPAVEHGEHAGIGAALDQIEEALDDAAATIARMA